MSKIPPRKRKTAARSLHNICQKLRLPFHKSKAQALKGSGSQLADATPKSNPRGQ